MMCGCCCVVRCVLWVVSFCVVCCLTFVVCWLLFAVCCLLFNASCLLVNGVCRGLS